MRAAGFPCRGKRQKRNEEIEKEIFDRGAFKAYVRAMIPWLKKVEKVTVTEA